LFKANLTKTRTVIGIANNSKSSSALHVSFAGVVCGGSTGSLGKRGTEEERRRESLGFLPEGKKSQALIGRAGGEGGCGKQKAKLPVIFGL